MKQIIKTDGVHRRLEGWPLVFTILTTIAVLVGGTVEFLPLVLVKENIPRISTVTPLTPLEQAGRDIYIREGCNTCHSQMVRPFRDEIERYGEYSKPGESVYDHPFLWGSKRIGPDLARVGGKYPHLWHVRHMEDPRSTSPASIMPPYPWLLEKELDAAVMPVRLAALRKLGVPYTEAEVTSAESATLAQAKLVAEEIEAQGGPARLDRMEITAIVAYLQRLGADLKKTPVSTP